MTKTRRWLPTRRATQSELLDAGLHRLRERLGFTDRAPASSPRRSAAPVVVAATEDNPRAVLYTPDVDGHADPGEVVWFLAPGATPSDPPQERAMLIVARARYHEVLGLLISPDPQHSTDENWLDIGSGFWDPDGQRCFVRLDRVIKLPESELRREGALFPQGRFERVANELRSRFGWM